MKAMFRKVSRLFHGTNRRLSLLQPRGGHGVFAASKPEMALIHVVRKKTRGAVRFDPSGAKRLWVPERFKNRLKKAGFIYQVERRGFRKTTRSKNDTEYLAKHPVPIRRKINVRSVSGALLKRGWKIFWKDPPKRLQ